MKYLLILLLSFALPNYSYAQGKVKKKNKTEYKDKDGIDGRMKGPEGQTVYIGQRGGRYYLNTNGEKVYIVKKAKKKKG
jgi:hypothetical protein